MAIDLDRALGASVGTAETTWTARDVVIYHLGIGAGADPMSERELCYVLEDRLKVLPTFGVPLSADGVRGLHGVPGLEFDHTKMLHGEHEIELTAPLPVSGTVTTRGRVAAIYDKGKAAVTVVDAVSTDAAGTVLFTNRYSLFMRGAGGFGGPSGPSTAFTLPDREPDLVVEQRTLPQQALLYRLSGDVNPLHADPAVAAKAGFPRPILHGICTFGIACKAAVESALDGDVTAVRRFGARFSGVVYPGETIVTRLWRADGSLLFEASVKERDVTVLSHGRLEMRA